LTELTKKILESGALVVLCTPSVIGEKQKGKNPLDPMLDEYSEIMRLVADEQQVALCDLRQAFLRYESDHNAANAERGLLTYDGVHLSDTGNKLVADELIKLLESQ